MKNKIEIPIEIELQLLELGVNILELAKDIENLMDAEHVYENYKCLTH